MIYGKLTTEDWRTAHVMGEEAESSFESHNLRLFFYGTLYNRDVLQAAPDDSNAKLAAEAYLNDLLSGFSRLDGSFIIVYYSANECGIVRDHHGTYYPVYCTLDGYFATSWKYLAKLVKSYSYNPVALSQFLQRGIMSETNFVISNFVRLNAGEQFYVTYVERSIPSLKVSLLVDSDISTKLGRDFNLKKNEEHKFYFNQLNCSKVYTHNPKVVKEKNFNLEACALRFGELHVRAIKRRIGTSTRVGILLSGGYDSGSNLAALRSVYDGPIDSYSVGFKGNSWTELPKARLMSETFGTRHHEYEIEGNEIKYLPDIVRFLGEPFVEGGLMLNYCAMRMVADDRPDVILGGDGSDEYFGSSGREVALHYLAARVGVRPLLRGINKLLSHNAFDTGGKLTCINFHLDKMLHLLEGQRFGFSDRCMKQLLQNPSANFQKRIPPLTDTRSFANLYTQHALVSDLEIVINRVIIYKASRMAQMFNNNLTFPFMDLEIYHFLQDLPVSLKCKGNSVFDIALGRFVSKYLLKYHYKPLLPKNIASQGGFAPMFLFFDDISQRARFKDFILSSSIMDDFLSREGVKKFLIDYDRIGAQKTVWFWYKQNLALQYFNLLTLVVWWEEFIVGREVRF